MPPPDSTPPPPPRALPTREELRLLRRGEMTLVQEIPWSSNYTFLVQLQLGESVAPAIYKPRRGEQPLWDFPTGTLFKREAAAFVLSDALGWHIVPPTVVRGGAYGLGMVQRFVEHDPNHHYFTFREPWRDDLTLIALFDAVANNADRKGGHCLLDDGGHIWAIDHGLCFHEEPKLRTVIWELAGTPIPTPLLADLARLDGALDSGEAPGGQLDRLLSPSEIAALRQRLAALIEGGRFPAPNPGRRHVPWPLV